MDDLRIRENLQLAISWLLLAAVFSFLIVLLVIW
jgi:hypothetical protein